MKPYHKIIIAILILSGFFSVNLKAQGDVRLSYIFASDSIAGFDETHTAQDALAHGCFGAEYKAFLYIQKRNFIKQKYNLQPTPVVPLTLFQNQIVAKTTAIGGACDNEDFEVATSQINAPGAIQGWTAQGGNNPNSCQPPNLTNSNNYTVYVAPTLDAKLGAFVSSYFDAASNTVPSGNAFVKLNDATAGNKAVKLTKSFIVGPTNALYQYAYLPVIQDGTHPCCEQPGFNIRITVTNTTSGSFTVLACPQISIAVPGSLCNYTPPTGAPIFSPTPAPGGGAWLYHNWAASAIDLTPYMGNQVTLDVVVVDCQFTAHGAYAYFDSKCAPMTVLGNNNPYPAGTPSITLPTCGAQSATICAPDGLGPYMWGGPGVVAPYNTPLNSNQCFTVGVSADFSLTMNPPGSCNPIVRVITVTITPAPYILASVTQAVCGGTAAVVSYTAAGSASVNPTIIWSPVPTQTAQTAVNLGTATFSAGVGVVTVTAYDPLGCKATATVMVNPSPPTPTVVIVNVSGSPSITCTTPSVVLTAGTSYTLNPLNYNWVSNSFTSANDSITVLSTATLITLTVSDPITGCQNTATTSIQVNTATPVFNVTPLNQGINCGPGVVATVTSVVTSPTVNVSQQWFGPDLVPNPILLGLVSIYNPVINGNNGTSTVIVTNMINGCTTTKTVLVVSTAGNYPSFNITSNLSSNQYTLGCSTKSVTDVNIINGNTNPQGGAISYTMLPPSFTGGINYTTSTVNTYTVNTPGTYTLIVRDNVNLCETRIPLAVIQNTFGPIVTTSAPTRTLDCYVPSVLLLGSSTTPNVTYLWKTNSNPPSFPNASLTVSTNTAGASVPSATVIDNYTLTVKDEGNLCLTTTVVTMYQNTRPPIARIAQSNPALTCIVFSVNLSNNNITGILPNTFFVTKNVVALLWEGPTPQQPLSNSSTYLGYVPGIYTMTAQDLNNGCISKTTTTVGDNRVYPVLSTNTLIALDCGASATGGVKLAATAIGLTPSQVTAQWQTPTNPVPNVKDITTLTLTTDGVGEYNLTVTTNSNGCTSSVFVNVINGVLTANFSADEVTGYAPLTVNFTNNTASSSTLTGTQNITSVWSFGNGTTKTTTVNTISAPTSAVYTQPGTYTVTMFTTKGSCIDTFVKVIRVDIPSKLEVPNVFTPNGDNSNDIFFVKTANLSEITALIYDRWGNKIYELTTGKGNIAWDGKTNIGTEAPDGTYFYIITAKGKDGQTYDKKGTVSLYR